MKSLFRFIGLRRLMEEKLRSFLTLLGIALGIALLVGIWLTSKSVITTFNTIIGQLRSTGDLYVNRRGLNFSEDAMKDVMAMDPRDCAAYEDDSPGPCIEAALPIVLFFSLIEGTDQHLVIYSTDLINAATVTRFQRKFEFKQTDSDMENMGDLLFYPDGIIITSSLADKLGLKLDDTLSILAVDGTVKFTVKGIIAPEGPAKMLDGNFGLLPYQQAQRLLGVEGKVFRLDLYLTPDLPDGAVSDARKEHVQAALQGKLPEDLLVEKQGDQVMFLEGGILKGTEITIGLGISLALFAAIFMIYNTVSTSVVRRRREIGILRSLGVLRRQIAALFIGETIAMGLTGAALGVGIGYYIEHIAIKIIHYRIHERFIKSFYLQIEPLTPVLIAAALIVGLGASLIAAFFPARAAARIAPVEAMRRVPTVITRRIRPLWLFMGGMAFVVMAVYFGRLEPTTVFGRADEPVGAYGGLFFLFVGFILMCPGATLMASKALRPIFVRFSGLEAGMAADNIRNNLPRASVTISALMLGLVMTVNQSAILESMKTTVNQWLDSIWNPDMVVMYGANAYGMMGLPIEGEMFPKVRAIPEVADVNGGLFIPFWHNGQMVDALFEDTDVTARRNRYVFRGEPLPDFERLLSAGKGVLATEVFKLRTGKGVGDMVQLRTPLGDERRYVIVGVIADFLSANGALVFDRDEGSKHWGIDNVLGFDIYFKEGYEIDRVKTVFRKLDEKRLEGLSIEGFRSATPEERAGEGDAVWLGESFARKYRFMAGQTLPLRVNSADGTIRDFTVAGVLPDAEIGEGAQLFIERAMWDKWWGRGPGTLKRLFRKWLKGDKPAYFGTMPSPGQSRFAREIAAGPDFVRQRFQEALNDVFGPNSHYNAFDPKTIRLEVRKMMDISFTSVAAIALVAVVVALLGIVNTLLTSVMDRKREIGIMRAIGGSRKQIRKTIIIEAAVMGAVAAIMGTAAGIIDSVMTIVYQGRFIVGWVLTYTFPTVWIVAIFIAAVIASMFSGYYPAQKATRMNIIESIEYE